MTTFKPRGYGQSWGLQWAGWDSWVFGYEYYPSSELRIDFGPLCFFLFWGTVCDDQGDDF